MQVIKTWIVKDTTGKIQSIFQTYEGYFFITSDQGLNFIKTEDAEVLIRRTSTQMP